MLADIAESEPQAAYSAYISGIQHRWKFVQRTVSHISEATEPLEHEIRQKLLPKMLGREISDLERDVWWIVDTNTPITCGCGKISDLDHLLTCKLGGYVIMTHNNIRDTLANLLRLHTPIAYQTGQKLFKKYTKRTRRRRRTSYLERMLNVEKATFTQAVFFTSGGMSKECEQFVNRVADLIARKRKERYCDVESQEKLASVTGRLNGTEAQLSRSEEKVKTLANLLNSTQEELESSQLNFTEAKKQLNVTKEKLDTTEEELKGVTSDLEEVTAELEGVTACLEEVTADLEEVTADMNRTETSLETVTGDLNSTQAELGAVSDHLETCSAGLKDIGRKFKDSRTFHNVTRWDVLLTPPYFNKVFSNELFRKLTTSWNMLERFVGMNMTEGVIQHFRYFHREPQCDVFEQLSHAMLEHFKGTEITSGLIAHFKETHTEESECENDTDTES
ncbi:uncharacterized protein LOC134818636 [Bolinopsis microptera]|uniref:uncharacterized protein LOC134818636 n=1 Tax=Bolinopsis microptera TaxID=2820187 RepID=UPI003079BE5E